MRLSGVRSQPASPSAARDILREAVRLGVDLINTAQAYGRSEDLIAEALHPYPEGLVIATKGGLGPGVRLRYLIHTGASLVAVKGSAKRAGDCVLCDETAELVRGDAEKYDVACAKSFGKLPRTPSSDE